jgi:hypothetical protein
MHVFQFRGFSAILVVLLAVVAALALLVALPSAFMMVLWNAMVFEASHGPQIDFVQGMLLWAFVAVMIKAIFNPSIKLPFQLVQQTPKAPKAGLDKTEKTDAAAEPAAPEAPAQLDNQQNQG